jgi:radical SAM protein with 4Fe4S-binding SPASM domain
MKDIMVYLKTTETCNLNCSHCFTNGINGRKIYFDVNKTVHWLKSLKDNLPMMKTLHIEFHGGEPFLAPIADMQKVYDEVNSMHDNITWGATTNLVFKLTDDKLEFMRTVLNKRIGTSWDPKIRFANEKQRELWENNVRTLIADGFTLKLFVSMSRDVTNTEPKEIIDYAIGLGIQEIDFERITMNGNAKKNLALWPSNKELDAWFLKYHEQIVEHNLRDKIYHNFMENIYAKTELNFPDAGTWCRNCEQKLFTLNADGTIAGCPNSAPEDHYGNIDMPFFELLLNPKRKEIIACEAARDPRCFVCPVFDICGSDCHQLEWEGDVCASPKSLMMKLKDNINNTVNKPKKLDVRLFKLHS